MEQIPMSQTLLQQNIKKELIERLQHAHLSPEKLAELTEVSGEIQGLIDQFIRLTTPPSPGVSLSPLPKELPQVAESGNIISESLSGLAKIGIVSGAHIVTPLSDGTTVEREVRITPEGLVVLSSIDQSRVGIMNEIYMPSDYHMLSEKFRAGMYHIATENTHPVSSQALSVDTSVSTTNQVSDMTHATAPRSDNILKPRKTLAELLQAEVSDSVQLAPEYQAPENPADTSAFVGDADKPHATQAGALSRETPPGVVSQTLPFPIIKLVRLEQSSSTLEQRSPRVHQFISQALLRVLVPNNIPSTPKPTSETLKVYPDVSQATIPEPISDTSMFSQVPPVAVPAVEILLDNSPVIQGHDMTLDDYQKSHGTSSSQTQHKRDPLSMFNN